MKDQGDACWSGLSSHNTATIWTTAAEEKGRQFLTTRSKTC